MEGLSHLFYIVVLVIFAIPAVIVLIYLVLGIKSLISGNRDNDHVKTRGGVWTIVICIVLVILTCLAWPRILNDL
jgi:hypothetical protein